ncbi:hybrid sensor histidine kinase/response regulator [Oceanobacter mangrovi]|uniref:hybrid sensor histidine kinase/response regulator n=1 Tax=Oceanobacter mangrovi TaxID=2862510 RepID=UPI001C8EAD2B|nr:ATP-binding protein [Oceanobacter mangrovi]
MSASQRIFKVRRHYNKWVADQTLEDYALRFTARSGRRMSIERVAQTALGATAFLALEGIAAAVTLNYGFTNTVVAMLVVCLVFFITGFPITYYSARHGLDIDLLTRGAGFGYLGSTITSLIYATFTFIFFAIEAVILAGALYALLGVPLAIGYFICAVAVIPIVTHGIRAISKFQSGTQLLWVGLQCAALLVVIVNESANLPGWTEYAGMGQALPDANALPRADGSSGGFNILLFGAAASVFFALVPQIGEQVDYLRFMPPRTEENHQRWWFWLVLAGPGWVLIGIIKMLLGSFLAYLAITQGMDYAQATDPTHMYQRVYFYLTQSEGTALLLAATMVIISQMKINVTNAYAGSIAWSNFFSRLTHSHPGRVVWLVFNVTIALLLMELGIYQALEAVLGVFAIVAVSWLGSLAADLLINKPLGLSPKVMEFKRSHLYDINPVGVGSMLLASTLGMLSYLGLFGDVLATLSHFVSLLTCFLAVPLIAWLTNGKYYIARTSPELLALDITPATPVARPQPIGMVATTHKCGVCENHFESEDMSWCPAYSLPICSLCCSLDVRCMDVCKPWGRVSRQITHFLSKFVSSRVVRLVNSRLGQFTALLLVVNLLTAALLALIYRQMAPVYPDEIRLLQQTLWTLFFTLLIVSGVVAWLFLLAHESRVVAQKESNKQTRKLMAEIEAHEETDRELQQAKELAERANAAKSRYLTGISHELRTPLQSVIGYAHLLASREDTPDTHQNGLQIIQRSGQYLTDLIDGLLDISRIEAGRLELFREQVELPPLIEQLQAMFAMEAGKKGIRFETSIQGKLPRWTMTDEKRLRQILINLLSNAVKYTREGEVRFDIRYRNQVAEFSIRDTGPGIESAELQRIFDPFERVRDQNTASLPGTGLGLTIVRLLVDIMGGDLKVDSEPGHGSCFRVALMLPWLSEQHGSQLASEDLLDIHRLAGYDGYQRSIMLVDDDPVVRGLLSDLLTPLGFVVLEAANASQCLKMLDQQMSKIPDLFLLDISMPGMSGLELAAVLRQQGIKQPLVMLSADAQEQDRSAAEQSIYNDYLVKPVTNRRLLTVVGGLLHLQWRWRNSEAGELAEGSLLVPEAAALDQAKSGLPALTDAQTERLRELQAYAEMGYRKGVQQSLQALAATDFPVALMDEAQALVSGFRFAELAERVVVWLAAQAEQQNGR